MSERYKFMVSAADYIIAVSDFVREDIIQTLHVEATQTDRIYLPVNIDLANQDPLSELAGKISSLLDYPPERKKLMEIREKLMETYAGDHAARAYLKVFCRD